MFARAATLAVSVLAAGLSPAGAAAPVRLTVDRSGDLRVPAATLKRLGVKAASNRTVCLQFPHRYQPKLPDPKAPRPKVSGRPGSAPKVMAGHKGHSHANVKLLPQDPVRFWIGLRADGSVLFKKTVLRPENIPLPGPPGTVYQATQSEGRLVLNPIQGK